MLYHAALRGDASVVATLVAEGADVDAQQPEDGSTPLIVAAMINSEAIARTLLDAGGDPNIGDHTGVTPLLVALMTSSDTQGLSRLLVGAGADVRQHPPHSLSALDLAAMRGNVAEALLLLEAGAEVNATSGKSGLPPLYYAAARGHESMCAALLGAGADPALVPELPTPQATLALLRSKRERVLFLLALRRRPGLLPPGLEREVAAFL